MRPKKTNKEDKAKNDEVHAKRVDMAKSDEVHEKELDMAKTMRYMRNTWICLKRFAT